MPSGHSTRSEPKLPIEAAAEPTIVWP